MAGICEEIIASIDISEVIGERVHLRPTRRGYSGRCPFHEDREPSFHVYMDTQSYYCFGCHESGNVITYVMKTENVGFPEALKILAYRAGITLPEYEHKSWKRSAYEILGMAAKFYADSLESSAGARAYLEQRKLDVSDIARFSLGYAHTSWDLLVRYLHSRKVADREMQELGLAMPGRYGMYDKFRGRLIFPIKDVTGRVTGFSGELLEGNGAKYISEFYGKRRHLYMLDRARSAIHAKKRTILVGGNMDAILLHKNGFTESVSSQGASLTGEQLRILSKLSGLCYVCYDRDITENKHLLQSMYALEKDGLTVYVIKLPETPEEYLAEHDADEFEEAVKEARPLIERHIYAHGVAKRELFKSLSGLDCGEVLWYKRQLSEVTGLPPSEVEKCVLSKRMPSEAKAEARAEDDYEAGLCALLFRSRECRLSITVSEVLSDFKDETAQYTALSILTENVSSLMDLWRTLGETGKLELLARGEKYCAGMGDSSEMEKWKKIYIELRQRNKCERLREIKRKMEKSEATAEELCEFARLKGECP